MFENNKRKENKGEREREGGAVICIPQYCVLRTSALG